jgi:hypothetical protein
MWSVSDHAFATVWEKQIENPPLRVRYIARLNAAYLGKAALNENWIALSCR